MTQSEIREMLKPVYYVYFIKCEDFIKIGYSINPQCRLIDIKTNNPFNSSLLHVVEYNYKSTAKEIEKELKLRFDNHKEHGEWFRIEGDLEDFIDFEMWGM